MPARTRISKDRRSETLVCRKGYKRASSALSVGCCGSGRYVFLGPDGGHYRRSNYARRVFRPACDGRHEAAGDRPGKLVVADATIWPGVPMAAWPPADPVR
jgi:hypothetical protein